MTDILGLDIGGANLKAVWLEYEQGQIMQETAISFPFQMWREKDCLSEALQTAMTNTAPKDKLPQAAAVTMTAELADVFITKRVGVRYVLDSLLETFPDIPLYALSLEGEFVPLSEARLRPLDFAASNWLATAHYVALEHPDCLLVDAGSTTTDIIPILGGKVRAEGRTDLDRLAAGELVYTGALRTHLPAIIHSVPVRGRLCRVSSEYFAISGDVHLILGHLGPEEYTCPTPDGRPPTLESARGRLARLVCADTEALTSEEIDWMAGWIYEQQLGQIEAGIRQVLSRLPEARGGPLLAAGSGAFLGIAAGQRLGLETFDLAESWGEAGSTAGPSLAAAVLLARQIEAQGEFRSEADAGI